MRNRPGVYWSLASLVGLMLFFAPLLNGVVVGAFAGSYEQQPSRAAGHALAAAVALFPLWWITSLYGAVLPPFAQMNGFWRALASTVLMIASSAFICALRATRPAAA